MIEKNKSYKFHIIFRLYERKDVILQLKTQVIENG